MRGLMRATFAMGAGALGRFALAAPASATTETFSVTGAAQTWTVPAGVTSATFDLYGASGGGDASPTATAFRRGLGGRATATIAVTPGDSIQVNVGGQGTQITGGFNGGGTGTGGGGTGTPGNGGGGASDIRVGDTTLDDRVLVAGGGGGAGTVRCQPGPPNATSSGGGGGGAEGAPGDYEWLCGSSRRRGRDAEHRRQRHGPGDGGFTRPRWKRG